MPAALERINAMRDNIVFGSMAGAIGGVIGLILSYSLFLLGISPMASVHLAATLVTVDVIHLATGEVIWSIITHLVVASVFGILLTYVLLYSGREYWWFKGIGTGFVFCLVTHSYLIPLLRTDAQVRSLILNAPSFGAIGITHALIGLVSAFIIVKYRHLAGFSRQ